MAMTMRTTMTRTKTSTMTRTMTMTMTRTMTTTMTRTMTTTMTRTMTTTMTQTMTMLLYSGIYIKNHESHYLGYKTIANYMDIWMVILVCKGKILVYKITC